MINAWWLLPVFMAGGVGGVAVMCLMFAARESQEQMNRAMEEEKNGN